MSSHEYETEVKRRMDHNIWPQLTRARRAGIRETDYPQLPDDPVPGEYHCTECDLRVTVGPSGREYGHRPYYYNSKRGPCPRRPDRLLSETGREYLEQAREEPVCGD